MFLFGVGVKHFVFFGTLLFSETGSLWIASSQAGSASISSIGGMGISFRDQDIGIPAAVYGPEAPKIWKTFPCQKRKNIAGEG